MYRSMTFLFKFNDKLIYNTLHEITLAHKISASRYHCKRIREISRAKAQKNSIQRYNSKLYAENNGT